MYNADSMELKVDSSMFVISNRLFSLDFVFAQPMLGVSMTKFADALTVLVEDWLGPGNHHDLVGDLLKFADDNRDHRVLTFF